MAEETKKLRVELEAGTTSFTKGFDKAADSVGNLSKSFKGLDAKALGASFDSGSKKAANFADNLGKVSTTLARSADAFGLPRGAPLRTLDDLADVAELGFKNLGKTMAGFNTASLGIVGAGLAIGTAIGGMLNKFESVRNVADDATRGLFDFLQAKGLFGEASRDKGAGATQGLAEERARIAKINEGAIAKQVEFQKAAGVPLEEIAKSYKHISEEQKLQLGLTEKQVDVTQEVAKETERAAEAAKRAAEARAREVEALRRSSTGAVDAEQFARLKDALDGVGSASDIAETQVAQLAEQLLRAEQQGLPLPKLAEDIVQRWLGMQEAAAAVEAVNKALDDQKRIAGLLGPTIGEVKGKLDDLSRAAIRATKGSGNLTDLSDSQFRAFAEAVSKADDEARGLGTSINALTGGNVTLSAVLEEATRRGIELEGTFVGTKGEIKDATKAGYDFSQALQDAGAAAQVLGVNMDNTLGRMVTGLLQAASAAQRVSKVMKEAGGFGKLSTGQKIGVGIEGLGVVGSILGQGQGGGKGALQGAMKGAAFGSAFGPLGAAIGGAAGGLLGLFAKEPAWKKAAKEAGKILGRDVPQDMAEQILAESKKSGKSIAEVAKKILADEQRAVAVAARRNLEEGLATFQQGFEQATDALKDIDRSPALEAALASIGASLDAALGKAGLFRTPAALKESQAFGAAQTAAGGLAQAAAGARQAGVLDTGLQAALGVATTELRAQAEAAAAEAGLGPAEAARAGFGAVAQLLREQMNSQIQANGKVDAALQEQLDLAKASGIEILADPAIETLDVAKQQLSVQEQGFGVVAEKVDKGLTDVTAQVKATGAETASASASALEQVGSVVSDSVAVMGGTIGGVLGGLSAQMSAGIRTATGGIDVSGLPSFQKGGAGNFGTGTLAMLHGVEAVVPEDALDGGGGGDHIENTINVMIDESPWSSAERIEQARRFTVKAIENEVLRNLSLAIQEGKA